MSIQPIDVTGGASVYCFNEYQLKAAFELAESDSESGARVREAIQRLEETLSRNERAAAAFVTVDRLLKSAEH